MLQCIFIYLHLIFDAGLYVFSRDFGSPSHDFFKNVFTIVIAVVSHKPDLTNIDLNQAALYFIILYRFTLTLWHYQTNTLNVHFGSF